MKKFLQLFCLLSATSVYALNIQQETETLQHSLVSSHNLAFGQEDIFTADPIALADWNNIVQKIFSYVKRYGTTQEESAMGVCLAANIDLLDFVKKIALLKDKSKNIQRDLAGETQVILAMIKTLEALEKKHLQQPQTEVQKLLYHLIVTLETTLRTALKDLTAL